MSDDPCLVLLVDANAESAHQMRTALAVSTAPDYSVDHVGSLSEALGRLASRRYDVILLGLSLPDAPDLEGFQQMSDGSSGIPIVVIADAHEETTALRAVRAGADDMIVHEGETSEAVTEAICNAVERARDDRRRQGREKHLNLLAQQLPCVFWTTDPQLRITSFDGGDAAGMEVQPATLFGKDVGHLFPEDNRDVPFRAAHRQAMVGSSTSLDLERQGRVYRVHIEPFRDRDGRLIGAVGLAVDVTDRKLIDLELRLTRRIQAGLLPSSAPRIPGFDVAGSSVSVAEAGGDYFDYFPVKDQTTGIVVCDVGGHGLGPAMMMSQTRAYVRALALTYDDPGQILTLVNGFLCEDIDEERLVTLLFAKLDAATRTFTYSNAGHQGYWLGADGRAERFAPNSLPLNVLAETTATTAPPVVLTPGDLVLLYTDGIVENPTTDGGQFGTEQMLNVVRETRDQPAARIVETLLQAVRDQAPQKQIYDDMTVVVIKVD